MASTLTSAAQPYLNLAKRLMSVMSSVAGEGIRQKMSLIVRNDENWIVHRWKSGSSVGDWVIPDEWNIDDSYIEHISTGDRYAMLKDSFLHVLVHSEPVDIILSLKVT